MKVINLSEHNSVLNQFLREIRDVNIQKDPLRFRRNIERIGEVMAIELSKSLSYEQDAPLRADRCADAAGYRAGQYDFR